MAVGYYKRKRKTLSKPVIGIIPNWRELIDSVTRYGASKHHIAMHMDISREWLYSIYDGKSEPSYRAGLVLIALAEQVGGIDMSIFLATLFNKAPEICGVVCFVKQEEYEPEIEPEKKKTLLMCSEIAAIKRRERAEDAYINAIEQGHLTTSAIAKFLNRERSSVQQHLNKLRKRGIVARRGFEDGKTKPSTVWGLI